MHSAIFALVAISGLASAGPTTKAPKAQVECHGAGAYYVCAANGFRGYCSSDPCAVSWCPDYEHQTCDPVSAPEPCDETEENTEENTEECSEPVEEEEESTPEKKPEEECEAGYFQVCSNGFRGCCKSDACGSSWCPDYEAGTYEEPKTETEEPKTEETETEKPKTRACEPAKYNKLKVRGSDPTVCAPGTGYFQSCSNGFRGCCKGDACGASWCPDYEFGTYQPKTTESKTTEPKTTEHKTTKPKTEETETEETETEETEITEPKTAPTDPSVCPPNTGYFQSCSNGFRGCCKSDACGSSWCADYKHGTYQPIKSLKVKARQADPTVCAPGTGYFQSCSNGFRGCCKKDACAQKTPMCPN